MKKYLVGFWRSLPVQLLLLHLRRYQGFLVFWYILFATVSTGFLHRFGAVSLFLAPEYFGEVTVFSMFIVGFSLGIFIMSWNITTFILHSRSLQFLASTAQPFLKFCINNAILPLVYIVFFVFKAVDYARYQELFSVGDTWLLMLGLTGGVFLSVAIALIYFFGADKTIYYTMGSVIDKENLRYIKMASESKLPEEQNEMRIDWFLSASLRLRKPRDVRHYSAGFLDSIFKRHHVAAVIAISIAFIFLVLVGYTSDTRLFQIPAAASIIILFAILVSVSGAVSMFLRTWSILLMIFILLFINILYKKGVIDGRNKAYGLNYLNKNERPEYNSLAIKRLASDSGIESDKKQFIEILNRWKARQSSPKPVMFLINASGGGLRSAAFTMNALQRLDRLMDGKLMQQTMLINGASGGMLGAAYFRELYWLKVNGASINLQDSSYAANISKDLLSPLFSSFVTRDIMGPVQKFESNGYVYAKDRGYAFEKKLDENTHGILNKTLLQYVAAEEDALIPTMYFNSVVSRDGRRMIISTHPVRYLMRPSVNSIFSTFMDPDAIDFLSYFGKQNASNINILSALRMNATFPYVLPNVWLPTNPVIDVMDAGIRDNFGQETTLRFMEVFKDWLKENTSKVILLQLRDRGINDWENAEAGNNLISLMTGPFLFLQNNWFKLQDFYQQDAANYFSASYGPSFHQISFQYLPSQNDAPASLSFHLTAAEKRDITLALDNPMNKEQFEKLKQLMK